MRARSANHPSHQLKYRLEVANRAVLAVVGGYAVSALYAASLGLALPGPRAQAVLGATMLAFVLYCVLCIWAFCAASVRRAWLSFACLAAIPVLHLWLAGVAS